MPPTWINDLPSGAIDQSELDGVLLNWGSTALGAAAVPEPTAIVLLSLCCGMLALRARRP